MFLEHVNLTVSDLDRSIDFYCSLLGLKLRWRRLPGDPDGAPAAHVGDDRCYLALFEATEGNREQPAIADYDRVGVNHFGIVVDDLDQMRSRLTERGITAHLEADYEPGRRLYFYDPDRIEVELVEYDSSAVAATAQASSA